MRVEKFRKKEGGRWKQNMICILMFLLTGFLFSQEVRAQNAPTVVKARLINSQDIELYWSEDVSGAGWVESKNSNGKPVMQQQNYSVTVDGRDNPIYYYCWEEYGNAEYKGVVYYNTRNQYYPKNPDYHKTTIRLSQPIQNLENLPEIEVTIKGNKIKNKSGTAAAEQTVKVSEYEPFYQKEITLDCGVKIFGTAKVREEAMTKAEAMLKVILANKTVAERMGKQGCMLGIYGEGEIAYDIPEHRFEYDEAYLYVEGFGGTQLASIKDANVLRLKSGDYTTGYPDESILTHEFAHTVHSFGLNETQKAKLLNIYQSARSAGKWDNSYAGSNEYEYFATLSAIWFNAMDDTLDGTWDGVRGPVNTRAELKVYDKAAYDFLSTVYVSDQYLPAPWENGSVPDHNTYKGAEEPGEEEPGKEPEKKPEEGKPGEEPAPEAPEGNQQVKTYQVRFVYHNGTEDVVKEIKEGEQVTEQKTPVKKNYIFKGWYLAEKKYDFSASVTGNIVLEAKWNKVTVKKASFQKLKAYKGRKVLVYLNKVKNAEGYKITFTKHVKFKKSVKTRYTKSRKFLIRNLKKGTYYFKVQAYRTDSQGNKVLGKASKQKKITIKR
ncbi:InlB B-repeat-containing protein [Lachnospiraceae bacterium 45-W7]